MNRIITSVAKVILLLFCLLRFSGCDSASFNNPYSTDEAKSNIFYSTFSERPKTLDPARSFSAPEYVFIAQIYEPPLQYHYLLRPYTLVPLTAQQLPIIQKYDHKHELLPADAEPDLVAYTKYQIKIKPGRKYQPHPAFALDEQGQHLYLNLVDDYIKRHKINRLSDFNVTGQRELTAEDYVYQIKRLASPQVQSPIFGLMSEYIVGLKQFAQTLQLTKQQGFIDLRQYPLQGARVIDRYTFEVTIKGSYPQFIFWLAMPFFSPIPWEADCFYTQPGMKQNNISLDWYPVGTGAYYLTENNPNRRMVLTRNPNYYGELFPTQGEPEDRANGLLNDAGKMMPFIDQAIFILEKESIPRWHKFFQGYYDNSGISSDSFDQAIQIGAGGEVGLTPELQDKGIRLQTQIQPSIFYLGFNMLDPVVGGLSESARKLRQAISIALNYEEFIAIFANGRGVVAHGPIPPGIFGYKAGADSYNPYTHTIINGKIVRRPISDAKHLLAEAGYPEGRNVETGEPLILNYDVPMGSGPDQKAQFDWMREQFAKIDLQLNIRGTQYNRFQQKMRTGNNQLFMWGWNADYPDPENFFFLLYGLNGKVKHSGENASNYYNPEFDKLFDIMKNQANGPERQQQIDKMLEILRYDAPWAWGYNPRTYVLVHSWMRESKLHAVANNTLKYAKLKPELRADKRSAWNMPILWPLFVLIIISILIIIPIVVRYIRQEHKKPTL